MDHHQLHLEVSLHILQVLLQLGLDVVDVGSQAAQRALAPFCQGWSRSVWWWLNLELIVVVPAVCVCVCLFCVLCLCFEP